MDQRSTSGFVAASGSVLFVGAAVASSGRLVHYPVAAAQSMRYGLAAVALLVLARVLNRRLPRPSARELGYLVALAATGLVGFNLLLLLALEHADPAVPGLAVGAVPVVTAIIAPLMARRMPRAHQLTGAAVIVLGAFLVQGAGHADAVGIAASIGALFCEAAYTLLAVPILPRLGTWAVSVWTCALAAGALLVLALADGGAHAFPGPTGPELATLAYLSLGATTIGFVVWYAAVRSIGAVRASLVSGAVPISTMAFAVAFGTGHPSIAAVGGGAVVALGVVVGLAPSPVRARQALGRVQAAFARQ